MIDRSGSSEKAVLPFSYFFTIPCLSMTLPACCGTLGIRAYGDVFAR
jgi:hypothetical protein